MHPCAIHQTSSYHARKTAVRVCMAAVLAVTVFFILLTKASAISTVMTNFDRVNLLAKNMYYSAHFTTTIVDRYVLVQNILQMDFIRSLTDVAVVIASALVSIYFFTNIIRESLRGENTIEIWFKILATFMISIVLIANYGKIMTGIDFLGNAVISAFSGRDFSALNDPDSPFSPFSDEESGGTEAQESSGNDTPESSPTESTDSSDAGTVDFESEEGQFMLNCAKNAIGLLVEDGELRNDPDRIDEAARNMVESWNVGGGKDQDTVSAFITDAQAALKDLAENDDYGTGILAGIKFLAFSLFRIIFICTVDGYIIMIALQLIFRKILAPIAMADVSIEGTRSPGFRYLKRYFTLYLQMGVILVISRMAFAIILRAVSYYNQEGSAFNLGGVMGFYIILTCMGALIAAIAQSGAIAAEIAGD